MDVQDAAAVGVHDLRPDDPHEPGQRDAVDAFRLQHLSKREGVRRAVGVSCGIQDDSLHIPRSRSLQCERVGPVRDHENDPRSDHGIVQERLEGRPPSGGQHRHPRLHARTVWTGGRGCQTCWNGASASHDLNGNLTGDGTFTYLYNARNQLTTAKQGSTTLGSFVYDGLGRRVEKTISSIVSKFVYDGWNTVQEKDSKNKIAFNELEGLSLDQVFSRTPASGTASFLLTDALGSTVGLADTSGVIGATYTYEPFGRTTSSGASSTNPFQFTGRESDSTGTLALYNYRARSYSTTLQRFLTEDPIGFLGGDLNPYGYVKDMPVNEGDPLGLKGGSSGLLIVVIEPTPPVQPLPPSPEKILGQKDVAQATPQATPLPPPDPNANYEDGGFLDLVKNGFKCLVGGGIGALEGSKFGGEIAGGPGTIFGGIGGAILGCAGFILIPDPTVPIFP
jgi:RHS repeat-associated protein